MRISLILNSTMSKSCTRSCTKDWYQQEQKPYLLSTSDNKRPFSYEASSSKQASSLHSRSTPVSRIRPFPTFLNGCYELQWLLNSRTLSKALDATVKQIHCQSALLLFYFTLVLLLAQVAGLALLLSCAVSLPIGLQFMIGAVIIISVTAFKIMY